MSVEMRAKPETITLLTWLCSPFAGFRLRTVHKLANTFLAGGNYVERVFNLFIRSRAERVKNPVPRFLLPFNRLCFFLLTTV